MSLLERSEGPLAGSAQSFEIAIYGLKNEDYIPNLEKVAGSDDNQIEAASRAFNSRSWGGFRVANIQFRV
jgi:hypothetical protein